MSGKREKRIRNTLGISTKAKRGEAEFHRLVAHHMALRLDRRNRSRERRPRRLAIGALVVIAALGALAIGAVI